MATPTLINLPPPPSDPVTPSDMGPGTPNSGTTSLSALSTTAIKDGHKGTAPAHNHRHHRSDSGTSGTSTNTLDAERADRISRLAGLERIATARQTPPAGTGSGSYGAGSGAGYGSGIGSGNGSGTSHLPPHLQPYAQNSQTQTPASAAATSGSNGSGMGGFSAASVAAAGVHQSPGYFDNMINTGKERSTVGSASATGSAGGASAGRTTWASGSDDVTLDADKMSEDGVSSMGGVSDENNSLVGFGEAAGMTPAGGALGGLPGGGMHGVGHQGGVVGAAGAMQGVERTGRAEEEGREVMERTNA